MQKITKFLVALMLCCVLIVLAPISVRALSLSYWYSDDNEIGNWSSSPAIRYVKIDPSDTFSFFSGVWHGSSIWNSALGLSTSVSSQNTSAPIVIYGGTIEQIRELSIFNPIDDELLGRTVYLGFSYGGTHTYQGSTKYHYNLSSVAACVISRSDMTYDNYVKTASHELGHALGWYGHSNAWSSLWIMSQGVSTNTSLYEQEKLHLAQVY